MSKIEIQPTAKRSRIIIHHGKKLFYFRADIRRQKIIMKEVFEATVSKDFKLVGLKS